ncbi:Cytochrome c, mono-and diheme variants [Thalassovita gelatinovora]|uniref:Cytochrome c, mono-and diheme variants n=1 Tax=Thalassovita gelatinovora TaxID=53501 RepID=A0A0P1F7Q4_THAGE|nr:Cytochrome c, mono-and diheme variants [Thalassovita gelatinovora]SEQ82233.1 Cytochrome c [Thalassovita gelatinovora]
MYRTVFTATLIGMIATGGQAQEIDMSDAVESGRDLYMRHCATCHGLEADGAGPMAPVLLIQPKALASLSAENGGDFPLIRMIQRVDGRDPLVSHGSSMPVYGEFFEGDDTALKTPAGQPVMTSRPIADLVAYLLTIQE